MTQHVISLEPMFIGMESFYKITLIDDDPICHLIAEKIIQRFSLFRLENFTKPQDALAQLQWRATNEPEKLPDFILLDINMPHMDGWQFLEEFHKLPEHVVRKTSVMMLSSSSSQADFEKSKRYSAVKNFFSKPFTEETVEQMRKTLNGHNNSAIIPGSFTA
jgi:CheY-like chemotaxis protein